jgi:hypothetical protein
MDPKELRGLYEAYSEVYAPVDELYEGYMSPEKKIKPSPTRDGRSVGDMRKPYTDAMRKQDQIAMSKGKPYNDRVKKDSPMQLKKNESVDFYDIVLSYLIDEGYAETAEAAEIIMVNMSEEWRDSILDEAYVDYRRGKLPSGRTPQQAATGRANALKARQKRDEVLGKGSNPETYRQRGRLSKQSDTVSQMDRATTLGSRFPTRGNPGIVRGEPNTGRHQSAITKRDAIKASKEADKKTRG